MAFLGVIKNTFHYFFVAIMSTVNYYWWMKDSFITSKKRRKTLLGLYAGDGYEFETVGSHSELAFGVLEPSCMGVIEP